MKNVITVEEGVARHPLYRMAEPVNFELAVGEQLAIVGDNASGKSILVDTLLGRYPLLQNEVHYHFPTVTSKLVSDNLKYISFRDSYGSADATTYYQQRWNMMEQDGFPTVNELLGHCEDLGFQTNLYELFGIADMLEKPVIELIIRL